MSIAFRSASTAEANPGPGLTFTAPAGLAAGDLLIAVIQANGFPGAWASVPSGWTSLGRLSTVDTGEAWWRIATGSEGATELTFTGGGNTQYSGTCAAFSGVDGTTPVEASALATLASGTTYTSPSVTSLSAGAMLVQAWGADLNANSSLTPVTSGLAVAGQRTQGSTFILSGITYKLEASAAAYTYQVSHGAAAIGAQGWALALKPAAGGIAIAIARAPETDSAQALVRAKARAIAAPTESDTARALVSGKARAIAAALEADSAQALVRAKARAIAAPTETDTARALSPAKARAIAAALEADSAQALVRAKARAIAPAIEADAARGLASAKARAIAPALEADSARPIPAPVDEDAEATSRRALLLIGG